MRRSGGFSDRAGMTKITDLDHPASPNGKEVLVPATRAKWRTWLTRNASRQDGLWVVYRKKSSSIEGPMYDDLVEEALCFGWIDSQVRRVDDDRRIQWFSPRRKGSVWSPLNKKRIEQLVSNGLMTEAGQRAIDLAIADGSWSQADDIDALEVPPDLETAFAATPEARNAYESSPESAQKQYLWWIHSAKRDQTRSTRIRELVRKLSGDA